MSRCFPFPPPGYERKLIVEPFDVVNLLAKEKDKEKKEKKHRRDKSKEKKEGKEKDNEGSKIRHREKDKEKKEKHKHKDRDKKEKNPSRDEKRLGGGSFNVEKVGSNSPQSNQFSEISSVKELGRRISCVDGATQSQPADEIIDADHGRAELLDNVASSNSYNGSEGKPWFDQKTNGQRDNGQKRFPKVAIVCNRNGLDQRTKFGRCMEKEIGKPEEGRQKQKQKHHRNDRGEKNKVKDERRFEGHAGSREKLGYLGIQTDPNKDIAFTQEVGQRIRDENGATGSELIAKPNANSLKGDDSIGKIANGSKASYISHAKETSSLGSDIPGKGYGQRGNNDSRGPKVAIVHNVKGLEPSGHEMVKPTDVGKKVPIKGIERNGYSAIGSISHKQKNIKANDDDRNRAGTEGTAKQGGSGNIIKLSRLGENGNDFADSDKQYALVANNKALGRVTTKRKEPETNGFLHDNEVRPNKLPRTVLSNQPAVENGRKSQQSTNVNLSASKQGTTNSPKLDSKNLEACRMLDAQGPSFVSTKPPCTAAKANEPMVSQETSHCSTITVPAAVTANGTVGACGSPHGSTKLSSTKIKHKDRSSKPPRPHPDTKYLSEVLSIPKMEELLEFDDQEWLFEDNSFASKETKMGSSTDDIQHHVWAKSVHIEPADIYALPYVIPY